MNRFLSNHPDPTPGKSNRPAIPPHWRRSLRTGTMFRSKWSAYQAPHRRFHAAQPCARRRQQARSDGLIAPPLARRCSRSARRFWGPLRKFRRDVWARPWPLPGILSNMLSTKPTIAGVVYAPRNSLGCPLPIEVDLRIWMGKSCERVSGHPRPRLRFLLNRSRLKLRTAIRKAAQPLQIDRHRKAPATKSPVQWTDPVRLRGWPIVVPQGRAERARRIQSRTCESPADEDCRAKWIDRCRSPLSMRSRAFFATACPENR